MHGTVIGLNSFQHLPRILLASGYELFEPEHSPLSTETQGAGTEQLHALPLRSMAFWSLNFISAEPGALAT